LRDLDNNSVSNVIEEEEGDDGMMTMTEKPMADKPVTAAVMIRPFQNIILYSILVVSS
jgi:hypothetical protein